MEHAHLPGSLCLEARVRCLQRLELFLFVFSVCVFGFDFVVCVGFLFFFLALFFSGGGCVFFLTFFFFPHYPEKGYY